MMKSSTHKIKYTFVSIAVALSVPAFAQVVKETRETTTGPAGETTTTTTTSTGTISEFGGERLVIRSTTSPDPLAYRFTKTTTYVDEAGAPVSIETVKSGLPVTVHYVKEGDALIARKVIVKKKVTTDRPIAETKATTVMGTVSEFSPERVIIRTETSPDPIPYTFRKTTTYVDEAGAPVSIDLVKSGVPVTVHYTTEGDTRVATKVVVRKKTTKVEPR